MQIYDGLPIITNKITVEEQQGIPHHLLGAVALDKEPWRVGVFKRKAGKIIKEIRSRGRTPILVGGTHYYTQSLLFNDTLVSDADKSEGETESYVSRERINSKYPILERPTKEILEQLRQVDPVMADRWHPNERRKIQRSLEIYLMTGRRASDIYKEQRQRRMLHEGNVSHTDNASDPEDSSLLQSTLMFWVHADKEVLRERLDTRIDKMVKTGLLDEVTSLNTFLNKQVVAGIDVDLSRGIWVSIGFKEFEPYLTALKSDTLSNKEVEASLMASIERMKTATRQYSKSQIRWIRIKLMAALSNANALNSLYLLDASNLNRWSEDISDPAAEIVRKYIAQEELPLPIDLSPVAREILAPKQSLEFRDRTMVRQTCELCNMATVIEEEWQRHLKSRSHRRAVKKANRNVSRGMLEAQEKELTGDTESP
jgi:tRNA dimethylallyltransferase